MRRLFLFVFLLAPVLAWAAPGLPAVTSTPAPGGGQSYSFSIEALLFMTSLTFLPALLLMMTSFTRVVIVLSLLRQALGTMQAPPNQVIVGLSLFLTFFIMGPVFDKIYAVAWTPYTSNQIGFVEAVDQGSQPLKAFMLKQTRQEDLALFVKLSNGPALQSPEQTPMKILVPAYVISELKTAFQIGFIVFIPFLIIDMVVASVLMSMGMMMLSPMLVSMPFKLMLFVLADGWNLLIASLVQTYRI
ncbi:MAG: flagellar biosynthetic protein FliP [Hydrogenophilales bacterium CG03_land_8_20_14_0_80_62_28]|nr:flagellar type III secretion system pore protein FliP [Betaproteobacteria bacterium]OIO79298.1 MAG: flagellar biosynthetic protein FliP [Hydrogenophilaceae bacterium CG1_02_62_390]PIV23281.1 MAG: flagellar biosynthetic protein FliP [Hydrogenophilales bacterium CG03_land_8_20_14_0_80_62_28]PIW39017.1 MAG: flagellar biosynthetic protein FliP [Hydrogenophilales bacterium CG15_BIG_FIL_POST_REV_8_21_14_020_62_31]PIW70804.1 MAG: flagellar biosynthetic protein FliP [Hydrogenophilales bacterium CG12